MLVELQDSPSEIYHDTFQQWRADHPDGQFLTLETRTRATLHGAACKHLGNVDWTAEPVTNRHSLTRRRKILGRETGDLAAWAASKGVEVAACKHCLRDELVREEDLTPSVTAPAATAIAAPNTVQALEGQLRETRTLQASRNAALRDKALARAGGVCEGCGVNFVALFGGLGRSVLQVHHTHPLSQRAEPSVTNIDELAVLCANCHCIVHASQGSVLPVDELRRMYKRT